MAPIEIELSELVDKQLLLRQRQGRIGFVQGGEFHAFPDGTELVHAGRFKYRFTVHDGQQYFKDSDIVAPFIEGEPVYIVISQAQQEVA